jgi:hypothetical protein
MTCVLGSIRQYAQEHNLTPEEVRTGSGSSASAALTQSLASRIVPHSVGHVVRLQDHALPDEESKDAALFAKVLPPLQPLWSFFMALCHALQEDENELTAVDAYWLGLVDEVMGEEKLLTARWFEEWRPDPPQQPAPQSPPASSPQENTPQAKNETGKGETQTKADAATTGAQARPVEN